jgi:predicted permease
LVAIATLAVGVGASTTMFSLVHGAIFRAPPFEEAERLVLLNMTQRTPESPERRLRWSWRRFRVLEANVRSYEAIATTSSATLTLARAEDAEPLQAEVVSSRYLSVLRAPLALGRGFRAEDDVQGATQPTVILSHEVWRDRFGGEPGVVGRDVVLNGTTFTVIGVAARGFHGISGGARAWIPAGAAARVVHPAYQTIDENFITVVGRLREGASFEEARTELAVVGERIQAAQPIESDTPRDVFSAAPITVNDARLDARTARGLWLLAGATLVLLLVACVNVASLLLGRAAARRREIAARLALGASRSRLVRQLLTESAVIACGAGLVGGLAGAWATTVVRIPATITRGRGASAAIGEFSAPAADWRVLTFAIVLAGCTVVLFGLLPALQATRANIIADLKGADTSPARWGRAGRAVGRFGMREAAVTAQIALSAVLLMGCGLLLTSYGRLRDTRLGFESSRLLTFQLRPSETKYPPGAAPAFIARVLEEIERVPGVQTATVDGCAPLSVQCASAALHIVGRPWPGGEAPIVLRHYVAPSHFRTLGVEVVRGRALSDEDRAGRPKVTVINEAAARRYWPGEDPIGKRVWFDAALTFASVDSSAEIVGVVRDVAYQPLDGSPVQPDFFTSYAQFTYASRMVLVRTTGDPSEVVPDVAAAVRHVDPDLALFDVMTMEARAAQTWSKQRFQTALLATIAGVALALAVAGVYADTAYIIASRRREIGVRMALGARTVHIVATAMGATTRLALLGAALGIAGALAMSRILTSALYETSPLEPRVLAGVACIMVLVVIVASVIPVRRALRVDPAITLREG